MGKEHTIQTTLERLDKKPSLWKGLTIDELMVVTAASVITCCTISSITFWALFSLGLMGGVFGMIVSLGVIPFVAGRIERAKKQHGPLMWLKLQRYMQKRGWMSFSGMMTDKIRWDTRLSKHKTIRYLGPERK
ncbi:DUF3487 family protein [Aeromonas sp. Y311-2]|uniref:DUF3487 family protein n=1 Tax=Aeromonas sp. Y311-2 TaxID=2990507 RepID=UPI0022E5398A|nr:DUF3487 family protein [Aeromonas sp. Y311-2]